MNDDCTNKRFADMLHHYELGMLTDEQRREFELHLLECDYCFGRVEKLKRRPG